MYICDCNLKFYNTCILSCHTNKKYSGSDNTTKTISIKYYPILQDVSIITTNRANSEILPYGMYTTARKLCQVMSYSARLKMSGTISLLTPYALMAWTEITLLFNTMKEIHKILVMLVYVIVLKHRR